MTWRDADSTPVLGRLFSPYLEKRLGPARKADEPLTQRHHNLAASMQARSKKCWWRYWNGLANETPAKIALPCGRRRLQLRRERKDLRAPRLSSAFTSSLPPATPGFPSAPPSP